MVLTRDYSLQQGDTKKIVIPVFDSDDPNNDYFPNIDSSTIEFSVADAFGASTPIWTASASNIQFVDFSNVKLESADFDFSDVDDVSTSHTIPSTQDVIIVTIPQSETASFAGGDLVYQCRLTDSAGDRVTPVKGTITVNNSTPF